MSDFVKWHTGHYIRPDIKNGRDNDAWLITETIQHDEYRLRQLRLKNIQYIIDVGASIGVFAILAHELYPDAKIICIDPNYRTFDLLQKNVGSFAEIRCCGIFYRDNATLEFAEQDFGTKIIEDTNNNNHVDTMKLSPLIKEGCDILKLDCEYGEYDIIKYEELSKVRYIIGEWHETKKWNYAIESFLNINNYWRYDIIRDHGENGNFLLTNKRLKNE